MLPFFRHATRPNWDCVIYRQCRNQRSICERSCMVGLTRQTKETSRQHSLTHTHLLSKQDRFSMLRVPRTTNVFQRCLWYELHICCRCILVNVYLCESGFQPRGHQCLTVRVFAKLFACINLKFVWISLDECSNQPIYCIFTWKYEKYAC